MNNFHYDLYHTVIKSRDEIDNSEDYSITFNDFLTPNHYVGIKPRETNLK